MMRKALKRSLSVILAVAIIFSSAYVGLGEVDFSGAFAVKASAVTVNNMTLTLNDDGASYTVSKCSTAARNNIEIPESYEGLPVTAISDSAFYNCQRITSITVPDSVESIGDSAFKNCRRVQWIQLGDSVEYIGEGAFYGCSVMESINIPSGVTEIGYRAFYGCSALSSIVIPASVQALGTNMFYNCDALTSVEIKCNVSSLGASFFYGCTALSSVTLPDSLTSIGDSAFYNCSQLETIRLSDDLSEIGASAFRACKSLKKINIPDGVSSIGDKAFYGCEALTEVSLPDSVTSLGQYAFSGCLLLKKVKLPLGLAVLDSYTFDECPNLTEIIFPESLSSLGDCVFRGCLSLESIKLPAGVVSIGEYCFKDCEKLVDIAFPKALKTIGMYAFSGCDAFKYIFYEGSEEDRVKMTVYATGTEFSRAAFHYNSQGHSFGDFLTVQPTCEKDGFKGYECSVCGFIDVEENYSALGHYFEDGACSVCGKEKQFEYVIEDGAVIITAYLGADSFVTIPSLIDGLPVKSLNGAFVNCETLESVAIPETITFIGGSALSGCTNLKYIFYNGSAEDWTNITIEEGSADFSHDGMHLNAMNHSFSSWIIDTPLSCVVDGEKHRDCYVCNYTQTVVTPALGHSYSEEWTIDVEPTCTEEGSKSHHCTACSEKTDITAIESLGGHKYSEEWTIDVEPTCTEEGSKSHHCTVCDFKTDITAIEAKGHNLEKEVCLSCSYSLWRYHKYDDHIVITGYSGSKEDVAIPDVIEGLPVTEIYELAFYGNSVIRSVVIGDNVTKIGLGVFYECNNLERITISGSVAEIDPLAFVYCNSLKSFEVASDSSCFSAEDGVLFNKDKTMLVSYPPAKEGAVYEIPDSVTTISDMAFALAAYLEVIEVHKDVSVIGTAFVGDEKLEAVNVDENNNYYLSENGVVFNKDKTEIICYPACKEGTEYSIPDSVTTISDYAFGFCKKLEAVTIPDGVTTIGGNAFYDCFAISELELPDSLTTIGESAFSGCSSITELKLPDSVTKIGDFAFSGCESLKELAIPENITEITYGMFLGCINLNSVVIPAGVTTINSFSFQDCDNLEYVFYGGSESQWNDIYVESFSHYPDTAVVHFNATDHTYIEITDKQVTCTEDGLMHEECSVCGIEKAAVVIPSQGHNYGEWVVDVEPDCENSGEKSRHCANCSSRTDITEIEALGHSYSEEWVVDVEPDCVNSGEKSRHCGNCSSRTDVTEIEALGHSYSEEWVVDVEPDCENSGEKSRHCTNCSSRTDVTEIEALGHSYSEEWVVDVEPTCEESGEKSRHCANCDSRTDITEIEALGHSYSEKWVVDSVAGCVGSGESSRHCENCGDRIDIITTPPTGHFFVDSTQGCKYCSTTLREDLVTVFECAVLQSAHNYPNDSAGSMGCFESLGADYIEVVFSSSTYVEQDFDKILIYDENNSLVGEYTGSELANQTIIVPGKAVSITITSDSSVTGYGYYATCYGCQTALTCSNHLHKKVINRVEAGCVDDGYSGDVVCAVCEELFETGEVLPAHGHKYAIPDIGGLHPHTTDFECLFCQEIKEGTAFDPYCADCLEEVKNSIRETENTSIDYQRSIIYTSAQNCNDLEEILWLSESATAEIKPSYAHGDVELLGTGTVVTIYDGDKYIGSFIFVVEGDTNGDSVCDILDVFAVEKASGGSSALSGVYKMAADLDADDIVDINDYQEIVNKALAS